jgi:head-tail adaptor
VSILDPGSLKHRMTLEEAEDTPDGAGGATRAWVGVQDFWAELTPVSARYGVEDGSSEQRITHQLLYRAGPELTIARRLRFGERLFNIMSARDAVDDGSLKLALIEEIKA